MLAQKGAVLMSMYISASSWRCRMPMYVCYNNVNVESESE